MSKFLSTLLTLSLLFNLAFAQGTNPGNIVGKVFDPEGQPIGYANVLLMTAADSTMAKGEVTTDDGTFRFAGIAPANYWLKVSFVGFEDYQSDVFSLNVGQNLNLPTVNLLMPANDLAQVEVKAQRMLIEVQPDKTVFNVEGSINATGNTALELLKKSPGVVVDNNDNIILAGKNGVQVYVDGKPSQLSTADLAVQLRSMQSSEIDAIEIITNPSAKYDAEGNAGIINIRLKKDKRMGGNANVNLGYSYGLHHKYNASTTFNYRNKKLNFFGTYSFNGGTSENWLNLYRIQNDILFDQKSVMTSDGPYNSLKLGTDFFINKKSTLGVLVNGALNDRNWDNVANTPITDLTTGEGLQRLEATNDNTGERRRFEANVNYRYDDRESGISWNVDADYGIFRNKTESYQPNFYKSFDGETILDERIFTSTAPTDIDIYTFKFDHERNLWKGKLGVGAKTSYVRTDNTYNFFDIEDGVEVIDIDRSNNFVFNENINAAYATYSKQVKKWNFNIGLRMEQTNSEGILTAMKPVNNDRVDRNYIDFFPSGGVSVQVDQKNQLRLNYSRRIDRPNYQDLNPFEFKLDELTYRRGNPFLQPQYTHNVSLSHTFNYRLTTTLSYSYTSDFFANISDSTEVSRSFLETINLDHQRVVNLTISYPGSPTKWWDTYTNFGVYNTQNKADLGEGRVVDINQTTASLYHQSTFKLPKNFSFEVSGWYSSPSIWGAVYDTEANFAIDLGIQKRLWNKRGNLKISVTDIFHTASWRGIQEFAGFYVDASGGWESTQLRVNFSYLFGNDQVKKARKRNTGLEDETKRIN
ncbi:MAG: TonB-dependent receptor [Bacteroidota bacterium]